MAVSPPPATVSPSVNLPIPTKTPEDVDTNVYQNVWRQVAKAVDIGGPPLCAVPYIDRAHFFDLLNIFVEVEEPILNSLKLSKSKKYRYAGKFKNLVSFLTDNNDKINGICQLRDQTSLTGSFTEIEHHLTGKQGELMRNYKLHIENPKVHALHLKMEPGIAMGIDKTLPVVKDASAILIIAEVFSGSKVRVINVRCENNEDGENTDEYVPPNDPIPLAFGAIRVGMNANGVFKKSPRVVSRKNLEGLKHWIFSDGKIPEESACIKALTNGLTYNIDRRRTSYESLISPKVKKPKKRTISQKIDDGSGSTPYLAHEEYKPMPSVPQNIDDGSGNTPYLAHEEYKPMPSVPQNINDAGGNTFTTSTYLAKEEQNPMPIVHLPRNTNDGSSGTRYLAHAEYKPMRRVKRNTFTN